jgi:hypothetical protein
MKKYLLLLAILPLFCFGQVQNTDKLITVIGVSELEIEPDLISISMTARESENVKKESDLVIMEKKITNFLSTIGIKKENFILDKYSANTQPSLASGTKYKLNKTYKLIIPKASLLDTIVTKCFEFGMENLYVIKIDHSKIDSLRNDLLTRSLESAKEKAEIVTKTMGITLGKVSSINEAYQIVGNQANNYNNSFYNLEDIYVTGYGTTRSSRTGSTLALEKLHLSKTVIVKYEIN